MADEWGMGGKDRLATLGTLASSTYYRWARKAHRHETLCLPADALMRISYLLGIYKGLNTLFPREEDGLNWLKSPNTGAGFHGQSPYSLITDGTQVGMKFVRRHLDTWQAGQFPSAYEGDGNFETFTDEGIIVE